MNTVISVIYIRKLTLRDSRLRFGVGFYSTFVVADKVEAGRQALLCRGSISKKSVSQVYTKSADKENGEKGYLWTSDGPDTQGPSSKLKLPRVETVLLRFRELYDHRGG